MSISVPTPFAAFAPPAPQRDGVPSRAAAVWRDRLGLLLESTGEGVYGIDLDGLCTFINRAGARMLGYDPEEVLGRNMHELSHHSHPDGRHYPVGDCPIYSAFRAGVPCRIDSEVLWRRDGRPFAVEYSSYPILDGAEVLGAVVTFVDISERKRQQDQLREVRDQLAQRVTERTADLTQALSQLRELQAHVEQLREKERSRIAREIRDEFGSLMAGLKTDMGRVITGLRPAILDHLGLWATLERQVRDFAATSELVCDWSIDIAPGLKAPEGPLATAVFRIFEEMLSNVVRHARATQLVVRISATPSDITLRVKDNGRGAPPSAFERPDAWGMLGMRERASHFGGWLQVDSQPGQGTQLILSMPLYQAGAQSGLLQRGAA